MKKTNNLIYLGFAIHIIVSLLAGLDDEVILLFMAIPLLGNLVGLYFLSFTDHIKLGAKIFMWSSILFVPIGLIGVYGCRKVLDSLNEEEFFKEKVND